MLTKFRGSLAAAFALSLAFSTHGFSQDVPSPAVQAAFPEVAQSDLEIEEGYHLGVLANGMRYIIRANATPPEQGLVRMWVDFGSLAEDVDQQGYAHFIEHMAFNGTTNIPEGEMVSLLEREGLSFGADTNASTSFDATQYRLDLPRNDIDLLDTALMLMREVASEISFEDEAVEREKGIILSERRVRDTYGFRAGVDNIGFLWPGSRMSQRLPIGTVETIESATGDRLRQLYRLHYRPENVAIVVVGDYDPAEVEAMIAARFADWQGPPAMEPVGFGPVDLENAGQAAIYLDPALSDQVVVTQIEAWRDRPDTVANRAEQTQARIGYAILGRRLQRLARSENPPFRSASLRTASLGEDARYSQLVVNAAEDEWERGLAAAQAEYRRVLEYGFTQAELDEQLANIRASNETSVARAETRGSGVFVSGALALLRSGRIPTSPQSALERVEDLVPQMTPESVLAAFQEDLVAFESPLIRFQGGVAPEGGTEAMRAAWESGTSLALEPPAEQEAMTFAYTDFGAPGAIVSDETDPRLGIRQITFENGVMLNLKPTDLRENSVAVSVNIDGGNMLRTIDNPGATAMAGLLVSGGLGEHTADELQSVLAGRVAGLSFGSAAETFRLSRSTTPQDLELQLQLMAALITDPGFRPTGEEQFRRSVSDRYSRLTATPGAALSSEIGSIISDGNPLFSLPEESDLLSLTMAALQSDISERLSNGAIEVALVGDFEEDAAIALVAATLGALPQREMDFREYPERRARSFTADRSPRVLFHDGEADQAMLVMTWPTRDDDDFRESLVLEVLERVVRLQLQSIMREELGQTYSPSVNASQSGIYDDYGTFSMSAQVSTDTVDAARDAMLRALSELTDEPIAEDLILRARQPMLEQYDNALDSNSGWIGLATRAQSRPEVIERFLGAREQLESISAQDLQQAVTRYLVAEERLEISVLPRPQQQMP